MQLETLLIARIEELNELYLNNKILYCKNKLFWSTVWINRQILKEVFKKDYDWVN